MVYFCCEPWVAIFDRVFQTEKEGRHGIECPLTVSIQSSVGGFGHLTLRLLRVITPDLQGFVLVRSFSFCWFPKCNDWRIERITVWHTGEFWTTILYYIVIFDNENSYVLWMFLFNKTWRGDCLSDWIQWCQRLWAVVDARERRC